MATNIDGSTINIKENSLTAGHISMKGWELSVPGSIGDHTFTLSLPFDVDALAVHLILKNGETGDKASVIVGDDTVVGLVDNVAGYSAGDKIISVDASVLTNCFVGQVVKFASGTDKYWIIARDTTLNTITIHPKDGSDTGLVVGISDNDAVKLSTYMMDSVGIPDSNEVEFGMSKIGGSGIPSNTVTTIVVSNSSATAKTLVFGAEFLYGDV